MILRWYVWLSRSVTFCRLTNGQTDEGVPRTKSYFLPAFKFGWITFIPWEVSGVPLPPKDALKIGGEFWNSSWKGKGISNVWWSCLQIELPIGSKICNCTWIDETAHVSSRPEACTGKTNLDWRVLSSTKSV